MLSERQVRMKTNDWRTAARYGLPFGVGLTALGCAFGLLQAIAPSSQLHILPYLWLLAAVICAFLAGFLGARVSRSFIFGVNVGAVTCAVSLAPLFLVLAFGSLYQNEQIEPTGRYLPGIVNAVVVAVFLFCGGAACGSILGGFFSIPGAMLGRIQANLDGEKNPPEVQIDPPGEDEEVAQSALSPSEDITIPLSWPKSILMLVIALLFTAVGYSVARSTHGTSAGWYIVGLFGLGSLFILVTMCTNRPLLRVGNDGISYKGGVAFWQRGLVPWKNLSAIVFSSSWTRWDFGAKNLSLFIVGRRPRRITFQNWQLPFSTRDKLRAAVIRYRKQIDENEIVVRGIE